MSVYPINKKLSLSIVIPTKNRVKDLLECVESIIHQDTLPEEIIVVDQSGSPSAGELLKALLGKTQIKLVYIHDPKIPGLTHARNKGIRKCSGEVIFFLDDDVTLCEKCISEIMRIFIEDKEKKIAGVGALLISPKPTWAGVIFADIFFRGPFTVQRQLVKFYWDGEKRKEPFLALRLTGCSAYRRDIFKEFKFDENYIGYSPGEDVVFSYLVSKKYDLLLMPTAKIYHKLSSSNRASKKRFYQMHTFMWFYFFMKCVSKNPLNILAYLWLNLGLIFLSPSAIQGTIRGFWNIIRVLLQKTSLKEELRKVCK